MGLQVLDRELYSIGEAARLLHIHSMTLKRWLLGSWRKGVFYEPVLRESADHREAVTWGEFVEAGLLREYRDRDVPMQQLRPFIDRLREEFGIAYPLAHARPYIGEGKQLVMEVQEAEGIDRRLWVVVTGRQGQLVLADRARAFFDKVDFEEETAHRLYPVGKTSPVVIDAERSFGIPTVGGVRTENLFELFRAGDSVASIADVSDLKTEDVEAAIRYETSRAEAA